MGSVHRRSRSRLATVLALLAAGAAAMVIVGLLRRPAAAPLQPGDQPFQANATMIHDVDGDTIDVDIAGQRQRVRLIGVDTPETKKENVPVQCYGPEASRYTAALLPRGTELYLERDVVGRDDYGRLLAYVYRLPDRVFVNDALLRQGYARPLSIEPNLAHAAEFAEAARQAQHAGLGLWAACNAPAPTSGRG